MFNCALIKFNNNFSEYGNLVPIQEKINIPYEMKRIFYIYGVPKEAVRGEHAHKRIYQTIICLRGSVTIELSNTKEKEVFILNSPDEGLLICPMTWDKMYNFSEDAILLVIASDEYDESEYIRDYEEYARLANKIF